MYRFLKKVKDPYERRERRSPGITCPGDKADLSYASLQPHLGPWSNTASAHDMVTFLRLLFTPPALLIAYVHVMFI